MSGVPPIGGSISTPSPIGGAVPPGLGSTSTSTPSSSSIAPEQNEGLALLITFGILILLSTWDVTSKFALWVAIALVALIWNSAYQSGQAKTFFAALSK